jgi:osmotically-inducible protein OsmY
MSDAQLESDVDNRLPGSLSQQVQVQAQNGTVTLQGHVDNWNQVADAIDAAFAAGASLVNSQFAVGAAGSTAQGGAYPSYGYPAGQQGQPRTRQAPMAGQDQASTADLRLARQVASQLRQQLPPGQNVQPVQPQSIYVTVRQGTVTLHGYVQNSSDKQQAQQIVQSIQGVQNVRNDIIILSSRGPAGQGGNQGGWQGQTGTSGPSGWQSQGESQPQGSSGMGDQGMAGQNRRAPMEVWPRPLGSSSKISSLMPTSTSRPAKARSSCEGPSRITAPSKTPSRPPDPSAASRMCRITSE